MPPAGTATTAAHPAPGSQTLPWDPEGHLATSVDTIGTNIYDADGTRLVRREPAGSDVLPAGEELRHATATTVGCTRYNNHYSAAVATRNAVGPDLTRR